jgi:hypothetical protein
MEMKKISAAVILLLAGLLVSGCHKDSPQQKTPAHGLSAGVTGGKAETNMVSRDLGALTLTNHYETCVQLGTGKDCTFTPKLIDSHNVQLTLALKSRTATGKIHDLSVTQIVTRTGQPLEVAVGDFSLSLTPNVTTE